MASPPGSFPGREDLRLLPALRPAPLPFGFRDGRGYRRVDSRKAGTMAVAPLPRGAPVGKDPGSRGNGGGPRHGLRGTRPDVSGLPFRGDPPRPRGKDRPGGTPPRGAPQRPDSGGNPGRRPLRPGLSLRLRRVAGGVVRSAPVARGGAFGRQDGGSREFLRRPGGRLQPPRPGPGRGLLGLFQRNPRPRRGAAARSHGDPPPGPPLPEPRSGRLPAGPRRRSHAGDGTGGGRGAASGREENPARPWRQPPGELPRPPPHLPARLRGRSPGRDGGTSRAEREDGRFGGNRRRPQGDPYHAVGSLSAGDRDPGNHHGQPPVRGPDRGSPVVTGDPDPSGPSPPP